MVVSTVIRTSDHARSLPHMAQRGLAHGLTCRKLSSCRSAKASGRSRGCRSLASALHRCFGMSQSGDAKKPGGNWSRQAFQKTKSYVADVLFPEDKGRKRILQTFVFVLRFAKDSDTFCSLTLGCCCVIPCTLFYLL